LILEESGFKEPKFKVNNEIHIEENLENYLVLNINSKIYLVNKETKEKQEYSSYEKITFLDKEIFLVKDKK
jgi:hypothetical protein